MQVVLCIPYFVILPVVTNGSYGNIEEVSEVEWYL